MIEQIKKQTPILHRLYLGNNCTEDKIFISCAAFTDNLKVKVKILPKWFYYLNDLKKKKSISNKEKRSESCCDTKNEITTKKNIFRKLEELQKQACCYVKAIMEGNINMF